MLSAQPLLGNCSVNTLLQQYRDSFLCGGYITPITNIRAGSFEMNAATFKSVVSWRSKLKPGVQKNKRGLPVRM
jgi:hypothetical protein